MVNYKGSGTLYTEDSARFTIADSGNLSIQPAALEFDEVTIIDENHHISSDFLLTDGTNLEAITTETSCAVNTPKKCNATNIIFWEMANSSGATRTYQRAIKTQK